MAIINTLQSPPLWSAAFNPIIWMIESDETTQYKFRYVFDVYINNNPKVRFKTPPNPEGKGLIDVNTLVGAQIEIPSNLPMLSGLPFYMGDYLAADVYILAGEEYATTIDGNSVIYDGLGAVGEPAYGLYADTNFRPTPNSTTPVIGWAAAQNPEPYYTWIATGGELVLNYEMALGQVNDTGGKFLTTCPDSPQTIRSDEDFTLTWLNRNFEAATGPQTFPYAMVVDFYNDGVSVGSSTFYNTVANGGIWPSCSVAPSPATGASGPENYLESFKINPAQTFTYTRGKEEIFGPEWQFGLYSPTSDTFDSQVSAGLTPPVSGISIGSFDDTWLTCDFGATGSTEIVYRAMQAATGAVLDIEMSSANAWGTDFPVLQLWGTTSTTLTTGANWEKLGDFAISEEPTSFTYYTFAGTTTKQYYALGLRFKITTSGEFNEPLIGPTGYPSPSSLDCIQEWNITSSLTESFDKMCLALYPYDNLGSCTIGATAVSEAICLTIDDTNCWGFQPIRFTWINPLGGRDWYTFMKRNTFVQNASRSTLFKLPGYWSAATYSVQDNQPARFGTTVFRADLNNAWTASTDWLTEAESAWLREMFASPSVIAYLPDRTQPVGVIIQDAEYAVQTIRRENLFQYFVSFVEALPDNTQGY